MKATFDFFDKELPYRRQGVGTEGERTIEVPIAIEFLRKFPLDTIVEIGAVMPYHEERLAELYTVVDLFDPWPGCVREDGEKTKIEKKNVLCISTLEHLGTGQYGPEEIDPSKADHAFDRIIEKAAHYLITMPIGENPAFDAHVKASLTHKSRSSNEAIGKRDAAVAADFMFKRISKANEWERLPRIQWDFEYGSPFPWGNGVVFVTNVKFG